MYYELVAELVRLVGEFEKVPAATPDIGTFWQWLSQHIESKGISEAEADWLGKAKGRSPDSAINTLLVHLYRYARLEAKTAIDNTMFSTPDDFIYLICLVSFGSMTKTALIRRNVHEKSAGMQIIKRLLDNGFVKQEDDGEDKRARMLHITAKGSKALDASMQKIRQASNNVTEPLSAQEKTDLIRLLSKLENFHESKSRGE